MPSRREQILARLFVVLKGIDGVQECVRCRGKLPTTKRPGIMLLDADEAADREIFGKGRTANSPNIIIMSPEIHVVLKDQTPDNLTIGTDLNTLLASIQKAVVTDPQLINLVARDDSIRYEGLVTDLGIDRTMTGEARITISFAYFLVPDEL